MKRDVGWDVALGFYVEKILWCVDSCNNLTDINLFEMRFEFMALIEGYELNVEA